MQLRKIFLTTAEFMRRYLWRRDILLLPTLFLMALATGSQLLAFALLAGGLRSSVSDTPISFMQLDLSFFGEPGYAIAAGILLLGISAGLEILLTLMAVRTGVNFGLRVLDKAQPNWDDFNNKQKRHMVKLASMTTQMSRLAINSLLPIFQFSSGVVVLGFIDPMLALMVVGVGAVALLSFVPTNIIDSKQKPFSFDPTVNAAELVDQRPDIRRMLAKRLHMYKSRRLIASINLLVLFFAIAIIAMVVDLAWAVQHYAEAIVIILLVSRVSITSLTRISLMLRMVSLNLSGLQQVYEVLDNGKLSGDDDDVEIVMDIEE